MQQKFAANFRCSWFCPTAKFKKNALAKEGMQFEGASGEMLV
jgi:hypothetical protein